MCPVEFKHGCSYGSLTAINNLLKEDRFIHVRNMIRDKTPFGELLKMDHKPALKKLVALNAVHTWNGKRLVIGHNEYEIDSKLVNKSLSLSITGDRIIKPRNENETAIFIGQANPQWRRDNKLLHSHVIAKFRDKDVTEVIAEPDEVAKLSKLYIALLFSALLFPKRQRIPLEYFYLLDDEAHFENLKLYRFDIEVAKFLTEGIATAKNAHTKSATVSGCLHVLESLYPERKLPMVHIQNKREREESEEVGQDEVKPALKRIARNSNRNWSGDYPLKKEPQSENPKIELVEIEDDSSEEDFNGEDYAEEEEEVTDDEVQQVDQVPNSSVPVKTETVDKVTPSVEHIGPGASFKGEHSYDCVAINDGKCEDVGGFRVLASQADLYKQIWLEYGHIASNKKLKYSYAQVLVVNDILNTITSMQYCRFSDLTSDMIEVWDHNIKNAENVEFNVRWVRVWLENLKKDFFEKEKLEAEMTEQDDLLKAEKKKYVAAKNALKEAEDNIAALETKMSPLIKERLKYDEKDGLSVSEWKSGAVVG